MSAENLPAVVNIACCTNMLNDFSYEICRTRTPVQAKTTASHRISHERMMTKNALHVVVEPFEAQNNIIEQP